MPDSEVVENAAPAEPVAVMPATMAQCHQVIGELRQQLQVQQEQIDKLQEQVKQDSSNSSKPPSSDGPRKSRRERRASERKRGAQRGHPGAYRALVDEAQVDRIIECPVPSQCKCGGEVASQGKPLRHQVFDVPEQVPAEVVKYHIYSGQCRACGETVRGVLPPGVPRGQIGPQMNEKQLWVHLLAYNLIRFLMAQAARTADVDPRELSFKHTLQLWTEWAGRGLCVTKDSEPLLALIAQCKVGHRPGRIEPRMRKRRPKPYPWLKVPRAQARREVAKHGHAQRAK